jgi:hypothetical protein
MNEESIDNFPSAKWAYGLISVFLLGMLIVALTVWLDMKNRPDLEKISEPTAVGDKVTLRFDPRQNPGHEVLQWKNQPYFLQNNEPVKLREFEALKVAKDDSGKVELYRVEKQSDQRVVLVKIGIDEFLRLTPR